MGRVFRARDVKLDRPVATRGPRELALGYRVVA
jgi:hypothetical protein